MRTRRSVVLASLLFLAACSSAPADLMGGNEPQAQKESVVIQGSDTEVQLVSDLAEAFSAVDADADLSVTGGGSAVGIAALLNGDTDIANSSRPLNDKEREQALAKGMEIGEFILARDGLSIIVHPGNAVPSLGVDQIGAIFRGEVTNWKDVGGADKPIVLYGRQSTSGTFGFFRDSVLKADYASSLRQMEGSQAIVDAVAADPDGLGYVGVGYVKDQDGAVRADLKVLPVSLLVGGEAVSSLDEASVLAGKYPISRPIYQYVDGTPAAGSAIERFLRFEASPEGLALVKNAGFYPPTAQDEAANAAFFGS